MILNPIRIYDPELGRFLQRDPLPNLMKVVGSSDGNALGIYDQSIFVDEIFAYLMLEMGGENLYTFGHGNPVNRMDATGFGDQGGFVLKFRAAMQQLGCQRGDMACAERARQLAGAMPDNIQGALSAFAQGAGQGLVATLDSTLNTVSFGAFDNPFATWFGAYDPCDPTFNSSKWAGRALGVALMAANLANGLRAGGQFTRGLRWMRTYDKAQSQVSNAAWKAMEAAGVTGDIAAKAAAVGAMDISVGGKVFNAFRAVLTRWYTLPTPAAGLAGPPLAGLVDRLIRNTNDVKAKDCGCDK